MRDEIDGRMWVTHHDELSAGIDRGIAAIRAGIARFAGWDGSTHQLIALVAAFVLTGLNIGFSSSAA